MDTTNEMLKNATNSRQESQFQYGGGGEGWTCIQLVPVPHFPWQRNSTYTEQRALGSKINNKMHEKFISLRLFLTFCFQPISSHNFN